MSSLVFFFIIASFIFIYQIRTSELEAIEQKKLAEKNSKLAQENEQKAINALRLYKEKKIAQSASREAAPASYEKAINLMRTGRFQKAQDQLQLTLSRDKNFTPAKVTLAELEFINFSFKESLEYIKINSLENYTGHFRSTLEKFKNIEKVTKASLSDIIKDLDYIIIEQMLALNFIQKSNIDADKIDILKLLIKRSNRHLKGNVQIQLQKDYFNIDLSTTKDFRYLIALNGLAINKLNLKNSGILHSSEFKYLRAKEINLENTNIDLFHNVLYLPNLKKVILTKNAYNYLDYRNFPHLKIEFK